MCQRIIFEWGATGFGAKREEWRNGKRKENLIRYPGILLKKWTVRTAAMKQGPRAGS